MGVGGAQRTREQRSGAAKGRSIQRKDLLPPQTSHFGSWVESGAVYSQINQYSVHFGFCTPQLPIFAFIFGLILAYILW
jgi:hypothetical protein